MKTVRVVCAKVIDGAVIYALPANDTVGSPLIVVDVELTVPLPKVVDVDPPDPPLFLQAVTLDVPVMLVESAASNHNANPGMDCGENPHTDFCDAAVANDIAPASYLD